MTNLAYEQLMNDKEVIRELDKRYLARQKKSEAKRRAKAVYYIKQKLFGFALAAMGFAVPALNGGDATASLILLPLGLYLIITRERVMIF